MRKLLVATLVAALGLTLVGPAVAKQPPTTKLKFKLDVHEVPAGTPVTGWVRAWTHGQGWETFAGAVLSVKVDGVEVGTVTTGADGLASISYTGLEGEHVMKVVYAGDETHKRAQRAQGFTVNPGAPAPEQEPEQEPAPEQTPAVAPSAPVLSGSAPAVALARLTWTVPSSDGGSPITGYRIYRGEEPGLEVLLTSVAGSVLTYDDTAVSSRQILYYVVTAVNAAGESVWSNEVEVGVQ